MRKRLAPIGRDDVRWGGARLLLRLLKDQLFQMGIEHHRITL